MQLAMDQHLAQNAVQVVTFTFQALQNVYNVKLENMPRNMVRKLANYAKREHTLIGLDLPNVLGVKQDIIRVREGYHLAWLVLQESIPKLDHRPVVSAHLECFLVNLAHRNVFNVQ